MSSLPPLTQQQQQQSGDAYSNSIVARYIENCATYGGRVLSSVTAVFKAAEGHGAAAKLPFPSSASTMSHASFSLAGGAGVNSSMGFLPPIASASAASRNTLNASVNASTASNGTVGPLGSAVIVGDDAAAPTPQPRHFIPPTSLDFSKEYMGDRSAVAIIRTIAERLPHLKRLSFASCGIGEEAAVALSEAFAGNEHLRELDVSGNPLYATSGRALIALLRASPHLYRLDVDTEEMPERVALAIRKAERRNYDICFPPPPPPPVFDKYQSRERLDALLGDLLGNGNASSSFSASFALGGGGGASLANISVIAATATAAAAAASASSLLPPIANGNTAASSASLSGVSAAASPPPPLALLQPPSPDAAAESVLASNAVRLVHYWNLRLGSFGVQYLLDKGLTLGSVGALIAMERRARRVEGLTDPRAVAPYRSPLGLLAAEVGRIGAQLACPNSLLSRLSELREGGTIRLQHGTCRDLLRRIGRALPVGGGGYADDAERADCQQRLDGGEGANGTNDVAESATNEVDAKKNSEEKEEKEEKDVTALIARLMVTLHHLRMAIAAPTLRDFCDADSRVARLNEKVNGSAANSPNNASSPLHLEGVCSDLEAYLHDIAAFLSRTVYESSRQLSLLCDEIRYFAANHRDYAEAVAARGRTMTRKATTAPAEREDEGGALTAFAAALYTNLLDEATGSGSSSLNAPQQQRNALRARLEALLQIPFATDAAPSALIASGFSTIASLRSTTAAATSSDRLSPSPASPSSGVRPPAVPASLRGAAAAFATFTDGTAYSGGAAAPHDADAARLSAVYGTAASSIAGAAATKQSNANNSNNPLPTLVDFLSRYEEARAHQGGIAERFPAEWGPVAGYLHPFFAWDAPTLAAGADPYAAFALPAVPDRPRPTRAADTFAAVGDAIVRGPTGSGEGSLSGAPHSATHSFAAPAEGADALFAFGSVTNKALLLRWFRQYGGFVRYHFILGNAGVPLSE